MTSPERPDTEDSGTGHADAGLLSPVRAGSAAEAATGDAAFVRAMLDAEAALTRAQCALGHAPRSAAGAVTAAAAADGTCAVRDLALRSRGSGNPVVPLVADLTAAVDREDSGAGAYVHRGATSQDILDTASMLVAARTLPLITADLARAADALAGLAAEHRATPMAGRTLTQHAVPTTFGLKAAGWRHLLLDAHDRLASVLDGGLPAQLGGAAGTLAAFAAHAGTDAEELGPRLLDAFATETGLARPLLPWHILRTPVADLGGALAFCVGALGRLAADVLVLARTEIAEVAEGSGGRSSAMPHKANPVRATLISAAARQAPGLAAVLHSSLAAEDERPAGAWHAEWQPLRELLRLAGGAASNAAELAGGLRVFPQRMRANLDSSGGLALSERIAAELAPLLGRSRAGALLTAAARRATGDGISLREALAAEPELTAVLTGARLDDLTDPARYIGSAPGLTDRALRRRPAAVPSPGAHSPGAAP